MVERYVQALGARRSALGARRSARGARLVIEPAAPTLASTAGEIRTALNADAPSDALRLAIQFLDDIHASDVADAVRDEPGYTGSRRWDALLAGIAEHVAVQAGVPVPGWASAPRRFLPDFWFVIEDVLGRPAPGLAAIAFATAPSSLANRGVFLD